MRSVLTRVVVVALATLVAGVAGGPAATAAMPGDDVARVPSSSPRPAPSSTTDQRLDGIAVPPSAESVRRLRAAQDGVRTQSVAPGAPGAAGAELPQYATSDQPRVEVAPSLRAYALTTPVALGAGTRDDQNVAMFLLDGHLYNHPVVQAADGLKAIESYRITGTAAYLDQALADGQRLVDTRVESRGGWFFPYPFDFRLHGRVTETIRAPWYSGMAQGEALSLFVRLADATGDEQWREAARNTLTSFTLPPVEADASVPFVSWVDGDGHLWLEEYAQLPLSATDRTINGHLFAMFGLWDAVRGLGDERAAALFSGAASTIRSHILADARVPNWISRYCLKHVVLSDRYHLTVTGQLATVFLYTGSTDWARFSDTFRDDYPAPTKGGTVDLAKGKVTGYTFDSAGRQTAAKSITLARASSAPAATRQRIRSRGIYYRITAGSLAGFWVQESYPAARLRGVYAGTDYHLARSAVFPAATVTGYRVNEATGATSSPLSRTFARASSAPFDRAWVVGGRPYVHITAGVYAGRWVPSGGLTLK